MWFSQIVNFLINVTFGKIVDYYNKCRYQNLLRSLEDEIYIYKSMELLLNKLDATRVGFYYFHNGGGSIVPGKSKYVSMVEEKIRDGDAISRKADLQRVIVTDEYLFSIINMLFAPDRRINVETDKLPKGRLRDTYVIDGVAESIVVYIASNPDHIWFMNICFDKEAGELGPEERTLIDNCRTSIANVLTKYFKISNRC